MEYPIGHIRYFIEPDIFLSFAINICCFTACRIRISLFLSLAVCCTACRITSRGGCRTATRWGGTTAFRPGVFLFHPSGFYFFLLFLCYRFVLFCASLLLLYIRYSSGRYNERQLIEVTVVRRVRPRAERRYHASHHPLTNKQIAIQLYY